MKEPLSSKETKFYFTLGEQSLLEKVSKACSVKVGWLASVMTAINICIFLFYVLLNL
ncbi:DUF6768 family protein [Maribacter antarcticus]|uniref:DUF6768 family protein n=1 Tax=Maribacter antarcticus TaxID=505250 RepID=UPI002934C18A|nr:DUF6768 family protein [Maribacter antarcticus]